MRVAVLLAIAACTHGGIPGPGASARPAHAPSKCPRLDVEQIVELPENTSNLHMIVDGAGVAHILWATVTSGPMYTQRAAYHHAKEVNGRWQQDDQGLPTDLEVSGFDAALAPDGKSIIVAIPETNEDAPKRFTVYAGPPWKAIGGVTTRAVTLTYDGSHTYAAAFGKTRLAIHRVTADSFDDAELYTADIPELAHNVRVRMTNEGLAVDLDDYESTTDREKPLRISNLDTEPKTRKVALGGVERGPVLESDGYFTFVKRGDRRIRIARHNEDLHACGPDCERRPPASFTGMLHASEARLAVRANDMVVVGMAWTVTGPIHFVLGPPDSRTDMSAYRRFMARHSGVLVAARIDDAHPIVIDETSLRLKYPISIGEVATDRRGRVHAVLYESVPVDDHVGYPRSRYVRLGCEP